jgi:hypothetical protein
VIPGVVVSTKRTGLIGAQPTDSPWARLLFLLVHPVSTAMGFHPCRVMGPAGRQEPTHGEGLNRRPAGI